MEHTILTDTIERVRATLTKDKLAKIIDATILSPTVTAKAVQDLLVATQRHGFRCAMIPPAYIPVVNSKAKELGVSLCSVVGFPYGYNATQAKVAEVEFLSNYEVEEVDVVANVTAVLSAQWGIVRNDLIEVASRAKEHGMSVKIIVEVPVLSDDRLESVVSIAYEAGADFVKTSTGVISKGGDPISTYRLYRVARKYGLHVKAAGGIRNGLQALLAIAAGASRIGTSSPVNVIETSGLV